MKKPESKSIIKYIHTINGSPAIFHKGGQICYTTYNRATKLVNSLSQIKKEQKLSKKWRKKMGFLNSIIKYGWIKIAIDKEEESK
uniref:Uncharacterized protein n=1 Tax=viral metagenome TaxID=1070528 RepID=A0A6H1ZRX2_9ZZZZ